MIKFTNDFRSVKRYLRKEKEGFLREKIEKYNPLMSLKQKVHILNVLLPNTYSILIYKNKDIYVFDHIMGWIYGDETETPIEVLIQYYYKHDCKSAINERIRR